MTPERYRWTPLGRLSTALRVLLIATGIVSVLGAIALGAPASRDTLILRLPAIGTRPVFIDS